MTDWTEHLARGRRWAEAAFWMLAAAMVALSLAAGAALAVWLDVDMGTNSAKETTIIIDLNALPPVEALAQLPAVSEPEPQAEPEPTPEPPPEPIPKPPPPVTKADVPDPLASPPPPKPEPKPEPKAEPKPKPEVKPTKPKRAEAKPRKPAKAEAKPEAPRMQVGSAGSKASKGQASANARAKWHAKVQAQLTRQLQKKSFKAKGTRLTLRVKVAGDGSFTASLASSSGQADLDAAVVAQLSRLGRLTVPPDGKAETLRLPVVLR